MNYLLCRNRVRNFDQWKRVFDSHADLHGKAGLKLAHLWHEVDNPRHVFFLFEVEDTERARAFLDNSEAATSAHDAGLIEGDFRFFGESLGYSPADQAKSLVVARTIESVAPTKDENNAPPAEAVSSSAPKAPEPEKSPESEKKSPELEKSPESEKKSPELEKSPESEKRPEPEKRSPEPEKNPTRSESVNRTEPAKSSTPPTAMKGPERVISAPPDEPFEGWKPVENWPPADEAANATHSTPEPSRPRGRWERIKY